MQLGKDGIAHIISKKVLIEKQKEIIREAESASVAAAKKETAKTAQAPLMNMSLKSRRDLINAIQNGKTLHAISNLHIISLLLLAALIILSSVEYGLFTSRYGDIMSNTNIFIKALDMETQIAQAIENSRNLILLNSGMLKNYENYTQASLYEKALRNNLQTIQANIDQTQKQMADLAKSFSKLMGILLTDKSLVIKFKIGKNMKNEMYNLLESIIMLNSYIFKIANAELSTLSDNNDDAYFVLANGLNGIFVRLRLALSFMRDDMNSYNTKALKELLAILICSAAVIFIAGILLIPFLRNVQNAKEEILMLFFQIKRNYAKTFAKQCQQFYNSLQKKRNRQGGGSEGEGSEKDMEEDDDEEEKNMLVADRNFSQQMGPTSRRLKKGSSNILTTILCELTINVILSSYFVLSYVLFGVLLFGSIEVLNGSFQTIYKINSAYFLDYLSIREMALNSTWEIEGKGSYASSQKMIDNLTLLQETVKDYFGLETSNTDMYFGGFTSIVDAVFDESLCVDGKNNYFTSKDTCAAFAHTIADKGMHPLICYATELSKQILYEYTYTNSTKAATYLNGQSIENLRICVKNMIYFNMQNIVNSIMNTVKDSNSILSNIKVGGFIGFMLLCALAYIFFWNPYVKKLNVELIRTKSMVSIIPFEIIRQVSDIQKYVLDNVIFAN